MSLPSVLLPMVTLMSCLLSISQYLSLCPSLPPSLPLSPSSSPSLLPILPPSLTASLSPFFSFPLHYPPPSQKLYCLFYSMANPGSYSCILLRYSSQKTRVDFKVVSSSVPVPGFGWQQLCGQSRKQGRTDQKWHREIDQSDLCK